MDDHKRTLIPWTKEEDEILRKYHIEHSSMWNGWKDLLPNRTKSAISHRITRIKAPCKTPPKKMIGRRVGYLTVLSKERITGTGKNKTYWYRCRCDCGNETVVSGSCLSSRKTISCGCAKTRENKSRATHGKSNTRLYRVWCGMRERCLNPNHKTYKDYGGRGIKVCDEWKDDFEAFYRWALAHGYDQDAPQGQCTIDRINVNGNYEPSNCRWVDMKTQCQNKRST